MLDFAQYLFKYHKFFILIPITFLFVSIFAILIQYSQTGEFFLRSIEMKGGTLITLNTEEQLDIAYIQNLLKQKFQPINVREIRSFSGYRTIIETSSEVKAEEILDELEKNRIDTSNANIESIGPSLGTSFWQQAQIAIIVAFVFMALVVFVIFRTFVSSFAIVLCAISDILMTLGFMQIFGVELSLAGLAAILMLIGYSVDTDILLTSRLLKETEEKALEKRLKSAMKTGLTMTLTSIGALFSLLLINISPVITQIATILFIGLSFDIMNTWITNSLILKWYLEKRMR
jgi:preprotein translocase subunit SecF